MESTRISKHECLVEKMIDGARALNEFFEEAIKENSDIYKLSKYISKKYDLTKNQEIYLKRVVVNTKKAIAYVKNLEDKYGVEIDADGRKKFKDSLGVFKEVYKKDLKDPSIIKKAHSYNICLGIEKEIQEKDTFGYTSRGEEYSNTTKPLRYNLGKRLTFFESPESKHIPTSQERMKFRKLVYMVFNKGKKAPKSITNLYDKKEFISNSLEEIRMHEIRHIIDHILKSDGDFQESQAYLFTKIHNVGFPLIGFELDIEHYNKTWIKPPQKRITTIKKENYPECILKREENLLKKRESKLQSIKNCAKLLRNRHFSQLNNQELSYIISTNQKPEKLAHRLELLIL